MHPGPRRAGGVWREAASSPESTWGDAATLDGVRPPRAIAAASSCLVALAIVVTGCGSSATTSITPREITFPVLWAGSNPDGTPAAGIEPATIAVGTEGDPGFSMTLEDVQAKKAAQQLKVRPAVLEVARPQPDLVRQQQRHASLALPREQQQRLVLNA